MKYERFKEIWEEFVKPQPITENTLIMEGSSDRVIEGLIAYGKGDKSIFDDAKNRLNIAKEVANSVRRLKAGELKNISTEIL
jgi:hypothetical protein